MQIILKYGQNIYIYIEKENVNASATTKSFLKDYFEEDMTDENKQKRDKRYKKE